MSSTTVLDARMIPVSVTPGVVDEAADYVYRNGQCLAFAVALAELGMTPAFVLAGGDLEWEREHDGNFALDDVDLFVHALGYDGVELHDITGTHDPDIVLEMTRDLHGTAVIVYGVPTDLDMLIAAPGVQHQDIDVARTMVAALYE